MAGSKSKAGILLSRLWTPPVPAPCSEGPDDWADAHEYIPDSVVQAAAIAICNFDCPFQHDCLESALKDEGSKETQYRFGIRGGTLPADRYRMYKDRLFRAKMEAMLI